MERFGLVGLPNAGKSSLFNALTGGGALAAPYAFATKDPNIGVARVPDERLDRLAAMSKSRNVVHAAVQVVDIGGLVEGASKGEGLGNRFLANIREVDAVVFVLRAFEDPDVVGSPDPLEHLRVLELELALADLETVEKRLAQTQRQAKLDRSLADELAALSAAYDALSAGRPLYRAGLSAERRELLRPHFLLTNRRVLAVVNVGEGDLDSIPAMEARIAAELTEAGDEVGSGVASPDDVGSGVASPDDVGSGVASPDDVVVIGMCVQLEAEAAAIEDPDERAEMLEGLGLGEGALFRMVRSAYHLLSLRTFLTTGDKESRAWTFLAGSTAPECAGRIHTDFQRGFIRAEVIRWDELLEIGAWTKAKEFGKIRVEGKDYHPVDGDVMEFRFNV
jgi:ribosome-binding ATPase YchF (GTP1/OBG family)